MNLLKKWFKTISCCLVLAILIPGNSIAQVSLTSSPYTQDFNTLASTLTSSVVPTGWAFLETGTNANLVYTAGTGSSNAGDTYSFGSSAASDRALGGVLSGTLTPLIGGGFTNNSGGTITSLTITYTGEQWRLGATARPDALLFQYSLNATSISTGTWTSVATLDFNAPVTTGIAGPLDGNLAINKTVVSSTISGLNIAQGSTVYIRWNDFNASGADDGLGIDDFSLSYVSVVPPISITSFSPLSGCEGSGITVTINGNNFIGVTSVAFNGTNAGFNTVSTTQIDAVLPAGATTGNITVTTGTGSATTSSPFTVNTNPAIICPANILTNTASNSCFANPTFSATATGTPAPTIAYSHPSGSSFATGSTSVTATATNLCNTASCNFTVTVTDATPPVANCQNITVPLNSSGTATITPAMVNNGSSDNCGTVNLVSVTPNAFTCADVNPPSVSPSVWINEIHYDNQSGDVNEFVELAGTAGINLANYAIVRYNGTTPSAAVIYSTPAQTTLLTGLIPNQSNGYGTFAVFYATDGLQNGTNDGLALVNTLTNTVVQLISYEGVMTVAAGQGLASGMTSTNLPFIEGGTLTNGSLRLAGNGVQYSSFSWQAESAPASPGTINLGQTFPASGITVTLTVSDAVGNISTCNATVTIQDITPPTAICQNISVNLNASGTASITAAQIDNGSTDACGIAGLSVTPNSFTCANIGPNTVTLTVTDNNGLSSTCTATVTIADTTPPTAICQNITVPLNSSGTATITPAMVNNGSSDNCGTVNLVSVTPNAFTCADVNPASVPPSVWINEIHYDNQSGDVNEFVELAGTAGINLANYAIVRYNGTTPSAAVIYSTPAQTTLLTGSIPDQSNGYGTFAVFYATDGLQNGTNDGLALVNTLTNTVVQLISYEGVMTVAAGQGLASGMTSINLPFSEAGTLTNGSLRLTGNGVQYSSFSWQAESAPASPGAINPGQTFPFSPPSGTTVTLTVSDVSGNISTCNATVFIQDITPPAAVCQNITANLNTTGTVSITGAQINNGSTDACGVASYSVSPSSFTCANVGISNPVVLTVTDINGNSATCNSNVTIEDITPPIANCQNISINLDATGNATITAAQINNGSADNCGIGPMSVTPSAFTCADVEGDPTTSLIISEYVEGSASNKYIEIYNGTGAAVNLSDYQLILYSNGASLPTNTNTLSGTLANGATAVYRNTAATLYAGPSTVLSSVNYNGDDAIALYRISTASYVDIFGNIGEDPGTAWGTSPQNTVDRTLRRKSSVLSGVTVDPTTGFPTLTQQWDFFGTDIISGLGSHTIDNANLVTLTVTDVNGNSSTCIAAVTVVDNIAPAVLCQDITVNLDASGNASISASQIDNGSTDACLIASMSVSPSSFTCSNLGPNTVVLSVTDVNNNTATCNAIVTVDDLIDPVITCPANIVSNNDPGDCGAVVNYITPSGTDNCSASVAQTAGLASGSVFPAGTTTNTFTITDAANNQTSCSFTVTVNDTELPLITGCPSDFSSCNPVTWTPPTITDNCAGVVVTPSHLPGSNFPAGNTTVTYDALDVYGNSSSCSFVVTRLSESVEADSITSNRLFNNICIGNDITLTLNGGSLGHLATWKWYSGSCGGTLVGTGTSITVQPLTTTTYFVMAEGACNNTTCTQITVTVSTGSPANVSIISAPAIGAVGQTGTLTVSTPAGATYYQYSSNLGHIAAVLFNGQVGPYITSSNSVTVSFMMPLQNYQIRVIALNACGRSNTASSHIRGTVPAPAAINGSTIACPLQSTSYSIAAIPGSNGYNWTLTPSTAGTIVGQGGLSITINWSASFTSATLCANGITNFNLAGPQTCITISNNAPTPGMISGNSLPCPGSSQVYSISPVSGAAGYNWSTLIPGASLVQAPDGLSATVTFPPGTFSGTICVSSSTSCGTSPQSCLNVSNGAPGIPSSISGPASGVCNASGINYTVIAPGATGFTWSSTDPFIQIVSGSTNSAVVNFLPGFTTGTLSVNVNYPCGPTMVSKVIGGAPATPTVSPAMICPGAGIAYFASSQSATSFTWTAINASYEQCSNFPLCSQYYIEWNTSGTLSVTASNTCGTSAPFNSFGSCRITENPVSMSIYPNPSMGMVTIEFYSQTAMQYHVEIVDITGRVVREKELIAVSGNNIYPVDLTDIRKGMYIVRLADNNGNVLVKRITLE